MVWGRRQRATSVHLRGVAVLVKKKKMTKRLRGVAVLGVLLFWGRRRRQRAKRGVVVLGKKKKQRIGGLIGR